VIVQHVFVVENLQLHLIAQFVHLTKFVLTEEFRIVAVLVVDVSMDGEDLIVPRAFSHLQIV
jgi:hypothetical protein